MIGSCSWSCKREKEIVKERRSRRVFWWCLAPLWAAGEGLWSSELGFRHPGMTCCSLAERSFARRQNEVAAAAANQTVRHGGAGGYCCGRSTVSFCACACRPAVHRELGRPSPTLLRIWLDHWNLRVEPSRSESETKHLVCLFIYVFACLCVYSFEGMCRREVHCATFSSI